MSGKYKPLLPAPPQPGTGTRAGSPGPPDDDTAPRRKRSLVRIACARCRAKKIAFTSTIGRQESGSPVQISFASSNMCDGRRPVCAPCSKRELDCSYDAEIYETRYMALKRENETLKNKTQQMSMLFERIRLAPDSVATDALRYIRSGMAPEAILPLIHQAIPFQRSPSPLASARAIYHHDFPSLKYELIVKHPNAYPALIPLDTCHVDLVLLGVSSILQNTKIREHSGSDAYSFEPQAKRVHPADPTVSFLPSANGSQTETLDPQRLLSDPGATFQWSYTDERLRFLDIAMWSTVPVTNQFAAEALSNYFAYEHPILGPFDADLFLDGLLSGDTRFCSSLLVNVLLAWSCQSYTHYEPSAATGSYAFFDEASNLWENDCQTDSLPTLSAGILMNLTCNNLGQGQRGLFYLESSAEMARRLRLVDEPDEPPTFSPLDLDDEDTRTAAAAVAWSVFNWQTLHSLYFLEAPSFSRGPSLPIPGENESSLGFSSAPDSAQRPLPDYMGRTFAAASRFWLIISEMTAVYYSDVRIVSLPEAEDIYHKLLAWSDELPLETGRAIVEHNHVVLLHIWYHTAILDLVRPFVESPQARLTNYASPDSWPLAVRAASMEQLMHLVYLYRASFEAANFSILYHTGMLYVLNYVLGDCSKAETLFYFYLCMRGYQSLSRCIPIAKEIVKGVFAMAIRADTILPADAYLFFDDVFKEAGELMASKEFILDSSYPIDRDLALTDLRAASVEALAELFESGRMSTVQDSETSIAESSLHSDIWKGTSGSLSKTLSKTLRKLDF